MRSSEDQSSMFSPSSIDDLLWAFFEITLSNNSTVYSIYTRQFSSSAVAYYYTRRNTLMVVQFYDLSLYFCTELCLFGTLQPGSWFKNSEIVLIFLQNHKNFLLEIQILNLICEYVYWLLILSNSLGNYFDLTIDLFFVHSIPRFWFLVPFGNKVTKIWKY